MGGSEVACLSDADLAAFLTGGGSSEQRLHWQRHMDACEACSGRVKGKDGKAVADETCGPTETGESLPRDDTIPGYKILKELHRGGQGIVYQAIQESTRRKVAVKVLLEGPFAGANAKRRFEREIAVVGSLRHANIVPIFDSGVTRGGYYFAMEYVRGEPLAQYAQEKKLSVDNTLRLFQKVCEAVDHAHQKGIIHRDLKPSNILVDSSGEPRVLDFGLARVGSHEMDDSQAQLLSVTGQIMGTLGYMSPEQAAGRQDLVDMRSDVYALGVILYRILTGESPYDVSHSMANSLRNIQEFEPARPCSLRREVTDEVDTIVLKALSKEKERRYYTAGALGQDIGRYLAGEAIEAKRDSVLYLFKRTLRRYKVAAAVAAGFLCVVAVAFVLSTTFWRQAVRQRDAATFERDQAEEARQLADTRLEEVAAARDEAETARRLSDSQADELRHRLYIYHVTRAATALEENRDNLMREMLDACPAILHGWEWHWLKGLSDRSRTTLRGHTASVQAVAYSPDGQRVVSGSADQTLKLWDAYTGRELGTLLGHSGPVQAVAYSPDGQRVVSGSADQTLKLWDANAGEELRTLLGHTAPVRAVAFSPL